MANGKTHLAVGIASGGAYAALARNRTQDNDWLLDLLAGMVGGYIGAKLPDILEPATSSWHRDFFHSFAVGAGTVAYTPGWLGQVEEHAHQQIVQNQLNLRWISDPQQRTKTEISILFWRFLVPFLRGLIAGYVSHLALDATTPRSLPLFFGRTGLIGTGL